MTFTQILFVILLVYFAVINLFGFFVSAHDKRVSKKEGHRRIPEKTFKITAALGGGIGVLVSFYTLRHKTKHTGLLIAVWLCTVVGLAWVCVLGWLILK